MNVRAAAIVSFAAAVCVAGATPFIGRAHADAPRMLAFARTRDWTVLGAGIAMNLGLKYGFANRAQPCRWCDGELNALDRVGRDVRWSLAAREQAAIISDVTLFATPVLAGTALVWMGQRAGVSGAASLQDAMMVGQAMAISGAITQVVKVSVRRHRPDARAAAVAGDWAQDDAEATLSFFSGHTSTTFSAVSAAATVASLRGYGAAPWLWSGLALAGATGYLRMAADRHYATDVLTGAAVGVAVGVVTTRVMRRRARAEPSLMLAPGVADGAVSLAFTGAF